MNGRTDATFTRILVPLDGSSLAEQALPYARAVGAPNASFDLINVAPPPEPRRDDVGRVVSSVDEVLERIEGEARETMAAAAHTWLDDDATVRLLVTVGDPAQEILRAAGQRDIDLIALASHGRGSVGRALFGSVADRVARASHLPVLVVRPRDALVEIDPIRVFRIVVPLDGSEWAASALPHAEALARRLHAPIELVRAINTAAVAVPFPDSVSVSAREMERLEAEARAELDEVAQGLRDRDLAAHVTVRFGWPHDVIMSGAGEGDLIVMTSHGRGGVRRWLMGSVAEKLVRFGPAPVLLIPVHTRSRIDPERTLAATAGAP